MLTDFKVQQQQPKTGHSFQYVITTASPQPIGQVCGINVDHVLTGEPDLFSGLG